MSNTPKRGWYLTWAPVIFVCGIIGSEYVIFVAYFLPKMTIPLHIEWVVTIIVIFSGLTWMLLWSWYKAIFTGPGQIPSNINDQYTNLEEIKARVEDQLKRRIAKAKRQNGKSGANGPRVQAAHDEETGLAKQEDKPEEDYWTSVQRESYCLRCAKIKYPRTHHCKICNRCIPRMDHHCPWVANCVGQQNHKYFILFLFYCVAPISMMILIYLFVYFLDYDAKRKLVTEGEDITFIFAFTMAIGLDLAIGYLLYFQLTSQAVNLTTVESHVDELNQHNPFDKKSTLKNLAEIFGEDTRMWLLPVDPKI